MAVVIWEVLRYLFAPDTHTQWIYLNILRYYTLSVIRDLFEIYISLFCFLFFFNGIEFQSQARIDVITIWWNRIDNKNEIKCGGFACKACKKSRLAFWLTFDSTVTMNLYAIARPFRCTVRITFNCFSACNNVKTGIVELITAVMYNLCGF